MERKTQYSFMKEKDLKECNDSGHSELIIYKASISRDALKMGIYEPEVTMVRETPMNEEQREDFYQPAVDFLATIYGEAVKKDRLI